LSASTTNKKRLQILLTGDQQPYCGSHERPTAFAAVLIAVLLMAVFPCSRCPEDAEREYWKDSRLSFGFIPSFPSVYSQYPHPPTPFLSVRYPSQRSQNPFMGFPWRRFLGASSHKKSFRIREYYLRILLILTPTTSPHHLQQWTPGARSSGQ